MTKTRKLLAIVAMLVATVMMVVMPGCVQGDRIRFTVGVMERRRIGYPYSRHRELVSTYERFLEIVESNESLHNLLYSEYDQEFFERSAFILLTFSNPGGGVRTRIRAVARENNILSVYVTHTPGIWMGVIADTRYICTIEVRQRDVVGIDDVTLVDIKRY